MKRKTIQRLLNDFQTEIYFYAYALIPDQLQARQIVLDSIDLVFNGDKDLIDEILFGDDSDIDQLKIKLRKVLLKHCFNLSSKRIDHLKTGIGINMMDQQVQANREFYELSFIERSVLFLKVKLKLDFDSIQEITNLDRYEVMTFIGKARDSLIRSQGRDGVSIPEILS